MVNGSQSEMTLKRLPSGGFLVMRGRRDESRGDYYDPFEFASTSIDDALSFIRDKVMPTPAVPANED